MNDFSQYSNRLQFHFWSIFCGQKVNFKWRSYQADRPLVAYKHDNSINITGSCIDPKFIPWMFLKSVLVKFKEGWP